MDITSSIKNTIFFVDALYVIIFMIVNIVQPEILQNANYYILIGVVCITNLPLVFKYMPILKS